MVHGIWYITHGPKHKACRDKNFEFIEAATGLVSCRSAQGLGATPISFDIYRVSDNDTVAS